MEQAVSAFRQFVWRSPDVVSTSTAIEMMFKRFIKPKWEHANPAVRRHALESLADQELITNIARSDPDPSVRRTACKMIGGLTTLTELADHERDAVVREFVSVRLRKRLCGTDAIPLPLRQRLDHLPAVTDPRLLEFVARQAKEPEMRLAALEKVDAPGVLGEIALEDTVALVRVAAARRLDERATLEQLKRKLGKKDKQVFRVVREKLKRIKERDAEPARINAGATAICDRLERLGRGYTWVQDRAVLELLDRQWQELGGLVDPGLASRFDASRRLFLEAYEDFRARNREQMEREEALAMRKEGKRRLLDGLSSVLESTSEPVLREAADTVPARWAALGPTDDADQDERRLEHQLAEQMNRLHEALKHIDQRQASEAKLLDLSQRLSELAGRGGTIELKVVRRWNREIASLREVLGHTALMQSLEQDLARLERRFENQQRKAENRLSQLPDRLSALNEALERGGLKEATSQRHGIQTDLDFIRRSGIGGNALHSAEQQLQRLLPRLVELQNWRKWGTDQHREQLCEAMESLLSAEMSPEALAFRLKEIQEEWKRLDTSGSAASRALWRRFHEAADRVFEKSRPYFDVQARQREANRVQREALCEELESFLDQVDWRKIDWKQTARAEKRMRDLWRDAGPVEHNQRRMLEKRFRAAMRRLEKPLAQERARNQEYKQQLIEQARTLINEVDVEQAIREAKQLQRRWSTTVAGSRRQEQMLWREFRNACNDVYRRQEDQRQAQRDSQMENAARLQGLCTELDKLVTEAIDDKNQLKQGFERLATSWQRNFALDLEPKRRRELSHRWQQAQLSYQDRLQDIDRRQQRRELDLLADRAALCVWLEQHLDEAESGQTLLARAQQRWAQLPPLASVELSRQMDVRYRAIEGALEQGGEARERLRLGEEERQGKREELCLRMEILAGIQSPGDVARQRLALQVDRLTGHMRGSDGQEQEQAVRLEQQWYLLGPGAPGSAQALEQRFRRAVSALWDMPEAEQLNDRHVPGAVAPVEWEGNEV